MIDDDLARAGVSARVIAEIRPVVTISAPAAAAAPVRPTVVPASPTPAAAPAPAEARATSKLAAGQVVNISTASKELLDALPGIGPVKAQAIIDGRPYATIEDIMKVKGIKQGEFAKIRNLIHRAIARQLEDTMGMFGDLMNRIFHAAGTAERPPDAAPAGVMPRSAVQVATANAAAPAAAQVDVTAVLDGLAAKNREKLDWRHSIVDLMKLVGMDSSFSARKALAADLRYTGDTNDSATMNMWLPKQVMQKLADNGGKVPAELLSR